MYEQRYITNHTEAGDKPGNWWTTIPILIIIALLVIFVHRSDQEHERREKEVEGLKSTVSIQSQAISDLVKECQGTGREKGKSRAP